MVDTMDVTLYIHRFIYFLLFFENCEIVLESNFSKQKNVLNHLKYCFPQSGDNFYLQTGHQRSSSHSFPFSAAPVVFPRPTVDLIGAMETQSEPSELELDDVVITNPHIEAILENEDWIEDAS